MKIINLMIVTLIVLIVAIGSVCAGTDDGLLSDGDDFDEDSEDDFDLDDGDDNDDLDDEDNDDEEDSDDDLDDDLDDDSDEDLDEEDESFEEEFDGEFDGEFTALSAGFDISSAKGMNGEMASNSAGGSQNSSDLSPKAGNPIGVLLLSLLFLIVIPLRNR
ncbi:hypothetical protein [Methanobrevibacter sp.]|uniref:hypothetical protein n=1 Tax=Methanobrevibacter sp. TaxID=66852 RepID=UPI003863DEC2